MILLWIITGVFVIAALFGAAMLIRAILVANGTVHNGIRETKGSVSDE